MKRLRNDYRCDKPRSQRNVFRKRRASNLNFCPSSCPCSRMKPFPYNAAVFDVPPSRMSNAIRFQRLAQKDIVMAVIEDNSITLFI